MITDCTFCTGSGYRKIIGGNGLTSIPCIYCNTRGKVSDELYDEELKHWMHGKKIDTGIK